MPFANTLLFLTSAIALAAPPVQNLTHLTSRPWRLTQAPSQRAPGSLWIFLGNGTMLQTSCGETYRIAGWKHDSKTGLLTITEDRRPAFTARILELTPATLRIEQNLVRSKEKRQLTLTAITTETVCPDLPKKP